MPRPINVHRFLDIQAEVDNDEYSEDESDEGDLDQFLESDGAEQDQVPPPSLDAIPPARPSRTGPSLRPLESLLPRHVQNIPIDPELLGQQSPVPLGIPQNVYMIKCRRGYESIVKRFIEVEMSRRESTQEGGVKVINAFDGSVYVDLPMLYPPWILSGILEKCVSIMKRPRNSEKRDMGVNIDMERVGSDGQWWIVEHAKHDTPFKTATWARFKLPKNSKISEYNNDLLYIRGVDDEARTARVVFIPRIHSSLIVSRSSEEPTFTTRDAALYTLGVDESGMPLYRMPYRKELLTPEGQQQFSRFSFEYGLIRLTLPLRNLRCPDSPATRHEATIFIGTNHPLVIRHFPAVEGWIFDPGDTVVESCVSSDDDIVHQHPREGVIESVDHAGLLVKTSEGSVLMDRSVLKTWRTGDYVKHCDGEEGWIVQSWKQTAVFIKDLSEYQRHCAIDNDTPLDEAFKESLILPDAIHREAHVNSLRKHAVPSISGTTVSESAPRAVRGTRLPWIDKEVIVIRGVNKGLRVVKDLLPSSSEPCGFFVMTMSSVVNAVKTLGKNSYADVLDARHSLPLHEVYPLTRAQAQDWPLVANYKHPRSRPATVMASPASNDLWETVDAENEESTPPPSRAATPTPEEIADVDAGLLRVRPKHQIRRLISHPSHKPFLEVLPIGTKLRVNLHGNHEHFNKPFTGRFKTIWREVVRHVHPRHGVTIESRLVMFHYPQAHGITPLTKTLEVEPKLPSTFSIQPVLVFQNNPRAGTVAARYSNSDGDHDEWLAVSIDIAERQINVTDSFPVRRTDCCEVAHEMDAKEFDQVFGRKSEILKKLRKENDADSRRKAETRKRKEPPA